MDTILTYTYTQIMVYINVLHTITTQIPRREVPRLVMMGDYADGPSEYKRMPACAAVP